MDAIQGMDAAVFRALNSGFTNRLFDAYMPFVTDKYNFLGILMLLGALAIAFDWEKALRVMLLAAVVVLASDFIGTELKHLVGRIRPCHALSGVRLLNGCSKSFSFPSGHATNIFAIMIFLSTRYKRFMPAFIFMATSVAYSRIYVGVHYPMDVMAGAILGTGCALIMSFVDARYGDKAMEFIKDKAGARR